MPCCIWCARELQGVNRRFCSRACEYALRHAITKALKSQRSHKRAPEKPIITDSAGYTPGSAHCANWGHPVEDGPRARDTATTIVYGDLIDTE